MAFSLVFVGIGVLLGVTSLVVALSPWVGGSIAWSALILCGMFLSFGLLSLRYFSREVISPKLSFSPFWESLRSIFQNQVEGDSALKSSSELRVVSSQQPAEGKQERQAS